MQSAGGFKGAVCADPADASAPEIAVASNSANACHADCRCGSLSNAIR
jgi:hypothetical protein